GTENLSLTIDALQEAAIEVVLMRVRDVQVIELTAGKRRCQEPVVREWEPRLLESWIEPRVDEDLFPGGVDHESGVAHVVELNRACHSQLRQRTVVNFNRELEGHPPSRRSSRPAVLPSSPGRAAATNTALRLSRTPGTRSGGSRDAHRPVAGAP